MRTFGKLAITGFIASSLLARANLPIPDAAANDGGATYDSAMVFTSLTPDAAAKLPAWLKPSDVVGMSRQTDDPIQMTERQDSRRVASHVRWSSNSRAKTESPSSIRYETHHVDEQSSGQQF
jgi:L-ascorbate metabolism protein UlaG (beta-lactamase superfamily)